MQRVDTPSAITTKPANEPAGTPGYFTKGDPSLSVPATVPGQDWFNSVQEELVAILTAAGVVPDKTDHGQIIAALEQLYWSSRNDGEGSGLDADLLDGYQANQMSRWVMNTSQGTPETVNYWAKLITFSTTISDYKRSQHEYLVLNKDASSAQILRLTIHLAQETTGLSGASRIHVHSISGTSLGGSLLAHTSFKLVGGASNGDNAELWVQRGNEFNYVELVEVGKQKTPNWIPNYNTNAAWQLAAPVGAVNITSDWAELPRAPGNIPPWHAGNDGSGSGLDADLLDGLHASAFALVSTVKPTAKSHGAKSANYTLNVNEAEVHTVEFTANATLTIASTLTVDRGLVIVKSNGFTVTIAGVNNNVPTITAAASVQDMLAVVKSFGKITVTAGAFGESAV